MRFSLLSQAATMASIASGANKNCLPGVQYCGTTLLERYPDLKCYMNTAAYVASVPRSHIPNTLFQCSKDNDYPGYVYVIKDCGNVRCALGPETGNDYCPGD
ncbi:hypothetical protein C8R43DRAFT_995365 [Mycena crocata]|nr:hypothetical protein C8R43DRAFT_995365 [Mycena crocata]